MIESCNDSIAEEIQRGFTTIKQMNRFAHSVDVPIKDIDFFETLDLTIKLSSFLSFASHVRITNPGKEIKSVLTCPFLMQNLIYQILCFTYESVGPDGEVHLQIDSKEKGGIHLVFSSSFELVLEGFPNRNIQKTADILGVEFNINTSSIELDIWIPYVSDKINLLSEEL